MDHCDYTFYSVAPWYDYRLYFRWTITCSFGYSDYYNISKNNSREKSSLDGGRTQGKDPVKALKGGDLHVGR